MTGLPPPTSSRTPRAFTGHSSIFVDPEARLVFGLLTVVLVGYLIPDGGRACGWLVFALTIGLGWVASGVEGIRRRSRRQREVHRALAEWSLLRASWRAERAAGRTGTHFLRARGYRDFALRQRILAVLERGGDPRLLRVE
jgi:hypothetical protein